MLGIAKRGLKWLGGWVVMAISLVLLSQPSTVMATTDANDTIRQNDQIMREWLNQQKPAKTDNLTTTNYPNASKSGYVSFDSSNNLIEQLRNSIPSPTVPSDTYDYYIARYDIDMVVNEDNTYDITEKLKVHFDEPRHGIIRKIPTYNEVTRLDGSKTSNRARISEVKVSDQYSVSGDGHYQSIKIGDPDETVTGDKTYEIKYKYDIGRDKLANADELYFNLIGSEWDTVIGEVNFTIHMPKSFDRSKLGFSSGSVGSIDNGNVLYTVSGNTIYGINKGYLPAATALTIRLTLPEGYYQRTSTLVDLIQDNYWWLAIVVSSALLLVALIIWFRHGREGLVTEVISYGPPDGMNSLDVGFINNGYASNKSVTSLLIYLANKGYLKIRVDSTDQGVIATGLFKSIMGQQDSYRIEKLKDYDGKVEAERLFLGGLFADGRTSVTETDLYNKFYETVGLIKSHEENSSLAKSIYIDNKKISSHHYGADDYSGSYSTAIGNNCARRWLGQHMARPNWWRGCFRFLCIHLVGN